MKCVIQGKVSGKRRRGRPKTSYSSDITGGMSESIEQITRDSRDRARWRILVQGAAWATERHSRYYSTLVKRADTMNRKRKQIVSKTKRDDWVEITRLVQVGEAGKFGSEFGGHDE